MRTALTCATAPAALSLLVLLGYTSASCAQRTKTATLDDILERLEANLTEYDVAVPSFFCDEHVISSQVEAGTRDQTTVTDSVFRLKRTLNRDHTTALVESREISTVDGRPTTSQRMNGPSLLSGVFEGALDVVSLNQTPCINYTLRANGDRSSEPYVVRFSTVLTPHNSAKCLLQENSSGRVLVDPTSMQITHLELTTPRHKINPESGWASGGVGRRFITVDYAPVSLAGRTFWMPSTITSRVTRGSGTFHLSVWSFQATYRNYHRLEVTSRLVPDSERPVP